MATTGDCNLAVDNYLDLTDAEAAALLGIAVGSVKSSLHRARATLARELKDQQ